MKKTILIFLSLFTFSILLTSCSSGNANVATEDSQVNEEELFLEENPDIIDDLEAAEDVNENVLDFESLPTWAKESGLHEPQGLTLDKENSSIVVKHSIHPDSFNATYVGDATISFSEAKKIAEELDLEILEEIPQANVLMADGDLEDSNISVVIAADFEKLSFSAVKR